MAMSSSKVHPHSTDAGRSESPDVPTNTALQESATTPEISLVIDSLKLKVDADRCAYIMKRMEENRNKLAEITRTHHKLSTERRNLGIINGDKVDNLLTRRQKEAIDMQSRVDISFGSSSNSQEDEYASVILLGSGIAVKNSVRPIHLPKVEKLPPYTTWIFMDRNQRMTEDQSVVGRRRIYYDRNGGEALICSDSEEEIINDEEDKKEFVDSEDNIIRMTIEEVGASDTVFDLLAQRLSRKPCEVKARHEALSSRQNVIESFDFNSFLDKDLEAAQDSFDNLFCRRCLIFDCKLHGCSQDLIFPAEKLTWDGPDEESVPCGPHCYLQVQKLEATPSMQLNTERTPALSSDASGVLVSRGKSNGPSLRRRSKPCKNGSIASNTQNVTESSDSETRPVHDVIPYHSPLPHKNKRGGKSGTHQRNSKHVANHVVTAMKRTQRNVASDSDSVASGSPGSRDREFLSNSLKESKEASSWSPKAKSSSMRRSRRKDSLVPDDHKSLQVQVPYPLVKKEDVSTCRKEVTDFKSWRTLEKALFEKGLEMFGRNSCLIARNLLGGLKTCSEVFHVLKCYENKPSSKGSDSTNSLGDGCRVDSNENMGLAQRRRSRFLRRRNRVRRLKYTSKSAAYHSMRKRISDKKDMPCRQYKPCGCQSACGDDCSCLKNGTTCEKYCGCPKTCKNRFRGCHCAKSQCGSRQCPCYAANRECDPDVCRHCWISCGDGSLGTPGRKGDNYECKNMKLLLKQQQRVLLGRSDISGWGAFLKNTVPKHEYLGEYTGELISHYEADKRGKIYDRENSSFLFNLNDQYVLDACRKGDKLKFANHSPVPNCYAKVLMVAGDHRVGIFAKERISAGEELFYDYRYEPDQAPAWAKKPEDSGSKKEDAAPSSGRAKKLA
ncbi:histone-lysine N-methyltransferase CLF-like isoform X1 [Cynara cardunculus var. scolymus]|uniref:histone-lysine N-methyltransferase CLF-like isoform X1 n=1 Tax=Cynara cardunculus var. scolymus TaxID=59895 RepID=UPI000D62670A|nr:histone-lysine N-methyltransferase CLF-like isoform X1 [Cynara cardunculus var. scolymus]